MNLLYVRKTEMCALGGYKLFTLKLIKVCALCAMTKRRFQDILGHSLLCVCVCVSRYTIDFVRIVSDTLCRHKFVQRTRREQLMNIKTCTRTRLIKNVCVIVRVQIQGSTLICSTQPQKYAYRVLEKDKDDICSSSSSSRSQKVGRRRNLRG